MSTASRRTLAPLGPRSSGREPGLQPEPGRRDGPEPDDQFAPGRWRLQRCRPGLRRPGLRGGLRARDQQQRVRRRRVRPPGPGLADGHCPGPRLAEQDRPEQGLAGAGRIARSASRRGRRRARAADARGPGRQRRRTGMLPLPAPGFPADRPVAATYRPKGLARPAPRSTSSCAVDSAESSTASHAPGLLGRSSNDTSLAVPATRIGAAASSDVC